MRSKSHIRLKLRHTLTILVGVFLIVGGIWMKGQAVSWAAPEQSPNQQTVPPRPTTPIPAPPQDDPSDDDDASPAPGPEAGTETPPPVQFPEPTPGGGDNGLTPVPTDESDTITNTTKILPTQTPGVNPPAGGNQLPSEADLSLAIFVDNDRPFVNQAITFTVVMSNSGPSNATNVAVSHSLPADLTLSRVEPTHGSFSKVSGLWLVPGLQVRQVVTLTIVATTTHAGLLTSTTEITAVDQFDPDSTPANGLEGEDDLDSVTVAAVLKTPARSQAEPNEPAEASQPVPIHTEETPSEYSIVFDLLGSRMWLCALGLGLFLILAGVFVANQSYTKQPKKTTDIEQGEVKYKN